MQHFVLVGAVLAGALVFWALSSSATSHALMSATSFISPVQTPLTLSVFQSPLPIPTRKPNWLLNTPRYPEYSATPVSPLPMTTASILSSSALATSTLTPRAYLPSVLNNYPPVLAYGAKGLAGDDSFNLLDQNYDVYYNWGVDPSNSDPRFARMVWCVDDYWLYTIGLAGQITQAAQSDAGHVVGRVWLIFNEPDNPSGTPPNDAQCGAYPFTGNPGDPNNHPKVYEDAAEAARRYSMVYDWIKNNDPNAKVYAGGILQLSWVGARNWWTTFISTLQARNELYKVEDVHVHAYPRWSNGQECDANYCAPEVAQLLDDWYHNYFVPFGLGDKPIWITEIGSEPFVSLCPHNTPPSWDQQIWLTARDKVMKPFAWWFSSDPQWPYSVEKNPGYDAVFWFIPWSINPVFGFPNWCSFLEDHHDVNQPATLTPLGEYWRSVNLNP